MFPTLSSLIKYVTGINVFLPVQTFGLFVALSFWLSYTVFKNEFIRKENEGLIYSFKQNIIIRRNASVKSLILYFAAGFIIGYKIVYILNRFSQFAFYLATIVFSFKGSITGGIIMGSVFLVWRYVTKRNAQVVLPSLLEEVVHPYQLMDKLLLWCSVIGFAGAILFAKVEYISQLFIDPLIYLVTFNGLAFYGGFIFGACSYLYITKKMGIGLLTAADIGSPGMMLAYGVGRMGCHLSGDGDWGIVNTAAKPSILSWAPDWVWSFNYPHNVIHQGKYIDGCADAYCTVLIEPVFPTSLYESICCLLLFAILWLCRNKIKRPGQMFFIFILCNGLDRFFIECIKINPSHCVVGLCLTQAQYVAIIFCFIGIAGLAITIKNRVSSKQKHTSLSS